MEDCEITVRLRPAASADSIDGERAGVVLARVRAPPRDGAANEALRRLIAKRARVGVQRVAIMRGQRSREKRVRVVGLGEAALRHALGLAPDDR